MILHNQISKVDILLKLTQEEKMSNRQLCSQRSNGLNEHCGYFLGSHVIIPKSKLRMYFVHFVHSVQMNLMNKFPQEVGRKRTNFCPTLERTEFVRSLLCIYGQSEQ